MGNESAAAAAWEALGRVQGVALAIESVIAALNAGNACDALRYSADVRRYQATLQERFEALVVELERVCAEQGFDVEVES